MGMSVRTNSWYYNIDSSLTTLADMQMEIKYDDTLDTIEVTGEGSPEQFTRASGPVALQPGQMMILYMANPGGIKAGEIDQELRLNIHADRSGAREFVTVMKG